MLLSSKTCDFIKTKLFCLHSVDQSVLVVGGGSSGIDIVAHLGKTASDVTFSQHKVPDESKEEREKRESIIPSNTTLQDDVKRFTATGVEFIDGSHKAFDVVIFATGEYFNFFVVFFRNEKFSQLFSKMKNFLSFFSKMKNRLSFLKNFVRTIC